MTTIAWDGEVLAGDTQMTDGDGFVAHNASKVVKVNNHLIGMCGDLSYLNHFLAWLFADASLKMEDSNQNNPFRAIVITPQKEIRAYAANGFYTVVSDSCFCIGSGSTIANAAMLCGKNAFEAVRVAAMLDIYTGGNVTYVSFLEESELTLIGKV